jgi:hypothetical protein
MVLGYWGGQLLTSENIPHRFTCHDIAHFYNDILNDRIAETSSNIDQSDDDWVSRGQMIGDRSLRLLHYCESSIDSNPIK